MTQIIQLLLPLKTGFFFDVGVNVGQTLIKVKSVDENAPYIGFEPNPHCVYYVKELIRINGFNNTEVIPVGIAEESRLLPLFFYSEGDLDPAASVVENFRAENIIKTEFVPCFSYDSISSSLADRPISILKIDVEGAELSVLKSMYRAIGIHRPFILIEILPIYSAQNKPRLDRQIEIEQIATSLNYSIFRIIKDNQEFQRFENLVEFGLTTKVEESDYLLCPSEYREMATKAGRHRH
jgi:FkbM family methyltransferase